MSLNLYKTITDVELSTWNFEDAMAFVGDVFYTAVTLDWKIKGNDAEIADCNFKSIKTIISKIPLIQSYLPNLKQFKKKTDLVVSE